jgi:hypothetical protein
VGLVAGLSKILGDTPRVAAEIKKQMKFEIKNTKFHCGV